MKRHIIVTEYNTAWPALFETETEKIQTILGETLVAVHHIGSTSVKGMKAKPTIDIMPVVHEIGTADPHKREFEAIGYEYLGEYGIPGRRYLRKVWGEDDLYHIHIFEEPVKYAIKVAEAPAFGISLHEYAPNIEPAQTYARIALEVMRSA